MSTPSACFESVQGAQCSTAGHLLQEEGRDGRMDVREPHLRCDALERSPQNQRTDSLLSSALVCRDACTVCRVLVGRC